MNLDRLNILVVDDNGHARALLIQVLRALGSSQIFEAGDGAEGLRILRERRIDIVLTDLIMAPMDGLALVRALRVEPDRRTAQIPLIMISGHSTLTSISQARDAGASEFLAKPFSARDLVERLQRTIERQRPFVRTSTFLGPDRRRRPDARHPGPWRRRTDRQQQANSVEI